MFNPDFDPYDTLIELQHSLIEIAKASNMQAQTIDSLISHIKTQDRKISNLVSRITILEQR